MKEACMIKGKQHNFGHNKPPNEKEGEKEGLVYSGMEKVVKEEPDHVGACLQIKTSSNIFIIHPPCR